MLRTIIILAIAAVLAAGGTAQASDYFEIKVKVNYDSDEAEHVGTGMILVKEEGWAHINIVVFENNSLRLSTSQSRARAGGPSDRQGRVVVNDELAGMIDLSLSPRERKRGDIRVTGELEVMSRNPGNDKPRFEFMTEPINFIVQGNDPFNFGFETGKGITELEITVSRSNGSSSASVTAGEDESGLVFETEYSLYNENDAAYEVEGHNCLLGSEGDYTEGERHCSWHAYYPIKNGDSLLYWVIYNIDDIDWVDDVNFDVTIDFSRTYAINAEGFDPDASEVIFNDATISLFSKEVRTQVGEVLDIILDDAPDHLPFKGKETIRLVSRRGK